jgi:nucleotide-binding universal stress UspA family protein
MANRLLLAIDDSRCAALAIDHASALARRDGASIHVLHVNTRLIGGRGFTVLSPGDAASVVRGGLDQLEELGVEVTGSVSTALSLYVADAIVDVALDRGCSAIVLGSERRRGPARLFGHGVRERVVRLSPLPVVIAPAPLHVSARPGPDRELALLVPDLQLRS